MSQYCIIIIHVYFSGVIGLRFISHIIDYERVVRDLCMNKFFMKSTTGHIHKHRGCNGGIANNISFFSDSEAYFPFFFFLQDFHSHYLQHFNLYLQIYLRHTYTY